MARAAAIVVLATVAAVLLWSLLHEEADRGEPPVVAEHERAPPELAGRGDGGRGLVAPLPAVDDPIDYVLGSLGAVAPEERRAHLLALIDADPGFLMKLVEWVGAPDGRPIGPPGPSTNDTAKARVHRALALIGEPAIPPLVDLLTAGRSEAQCEAALALAAIGPAAEGAVTPLVRAVEDEAGDRYLRAAALDALGAIGSPSEVILPLIHRTLRNPDCEEQLGLACARNLIRIGGANHEIFETCRLVFAGDWPQASAVLLRELVSLGTDARPVTSDLMRIYDTLRDEEGPWDLIAPALQAAGRHDQEVLEFLERAILIAREEGTRDGGAAQALAGLGDPGQQRLLAVAASGTDRERLRALELLGEAGQERSQLVSHIATFLRATNDQFRLEGLRLLGLIRARSDHTLPVLREYIQSEDPETRCVALRALGYAQEPTRDAVSLIQSSTANAVEDVAVAALDALAEVAPAWPDSALSTFLTATHDSRVQVAWSATAHLAVLAKSYPTRVIGRWVAALDDERIAEMAAWSLRDHAAHDRRAQKAFREMLSNPAANLRSVAAQGLGKAAQPGDLDALLRCTGDPDYRVRSSAIVALRSYAKHSVSRVMAAWIAALEDKHEVPRRVAAESLGQLGAQATTALPALERARRRYAATRHLAYPFQKAVEAIHGS